MAGIELEAEGELLLERLLISEAISAGIVGPEWLMSSTGVFVETGMELLDGAALDGLSELGSGGSAGNAMPLVLPELAVAELGVLNVLGMLAADVGLDKEGSTLLEVGRLRGGIAESKLLLGELVLVDEKGELLGPFEEPNVGAGVFPKLSKPDAELPLFAVRNGPDAPDTSGTASMSTRFWRSGFNGVSVPLSAT